MTFASAREGVTGVGTPPRLIFFANHVTRGFTFGNLNAVVVGYESLNDGLQVGKEISTKHNKSKSW